MNKPAHLPLTEAHSLNHHEIVVAYHTRTKHHFNAYAPGPTRIDWTAQPLSFRYYVGTQRFGLPLIADTLTTRYADLYTPAAVPPQPFDLRYISALLELSLGLSAWKQYGRQRWALRCNPSSGNLHPTEGYVVLPPGQDLASGIYHYVSCDHALEQRGLFSQQCTEQMQRALPAHSFLLGLTSIPWREAWKYGERAFRYCQHDIGHAIAAVRYAAAVLGWSVRMLSNWSDEEVATVLGLHRTEDFHPVEPEIPEVMLWIVTQPTILNDYVHSPHCCTFNGRALLQTMNQVTWTGKANVLDSQHQHEWALIDTIIQATTKPVTQKPLWNAPELPPLLTTTCNQSAADLIRQRRSAQTFDGKTPLSQSVFYRLLDCTLPRPAQPPWDVLPFSPCSHLLFFIHRVYGLGPGVYLLLRDASETETLQQAFQQPHFTWTKIEDCPSHLHFYQLIHADVQMIARLISCHQDIASDSAFSVGMLSEFIPNLQVAPWSYKYLFWETGIIGQILYLEAEAAGVRGTGIGCYFDDAVHELLGLTDLHYQSLYHFTVGTPLHDERLQTLPPYNLPQENLE